MDPITQISGPLDAASFNDEATAYGTKVLAEITQVTNKVNELVDGANELAGEVTDEEAARSAADSAMDVRMDAAEASIIPLQASAADHDSRIESLEANAASYGVVEIYNDSVSVTAAIAMATRVIVMQKIGADTSKSVHFLAHADDLLGCPPITVLNENFTTVQIDLIDDGSAVWGNGTSPVDTFVLLSANEYITLIPVASPTVQGQVDWHIIGGKSYSDITS